MLYCGVLAAHAAWRPRLDRAAAGGSAAPVAQSATRGADGAPSPAAPSVRHRSNLLWAQLMARSFGYDVLACARCGGRMRLLARIEQASVIARILTHLGLPTQVPAPSPARAPPLPLDPALRWVDDELPAV